MGLELGGAEQGGSSVDVDFINLNDSQLAHRFKYILRSSSDVQGGSAHYAQLVGLMHPDKGFPCAAALQTLGCAVSDFDDVKHLSLFHAIFSVSIWRCNSLVLDALVEFVISLARTKPKHLGLCLDILISNFMPPGYLLGSLKNPRGVKKKYEVLDRVHSALETLCNFIPLLPMKLAEIVKERMPTIYMEPQVRTLSPPPPIPKKKEKSTRMNVYTELTAIYVENMLRLESGALGKLVGRSMILQVVNRLIDLDVEIDSEDTLQDDFTKDIYNMELEDQDSQDISEHDGDKLHQHNSREKLFDRNAIAEQLDSLMVITFEHLKLSNDNGRLYQLFEILLESFDQTVLLTYKSKFTQFVIFYACSLDPENCGVQFAHTLLNTFLSSPFADKRRTAVAYLASYLSRATFVTDSFVVHMLERLVNWCSDFCKNQYSDRKPGQRQCRKDFYCVCQAFMYVLSFRMSSIILVPRLRSQLALMQIDDILMHPLNPLKVCLPSIVEEFLQVARSSHVFAIPENLVPDGVVESEILDGTERPNMIFPFDPCLLKESNRIIEPNYVYWSMVRRPCDEEDGESDEDSSNEDAGVVTRMVLGDDGEGFDYEDSNVDVDFGYSLNQMSITPKRSLSYRMQMPARIRPSTSPESL